MMHCPRCGSDAVVGQQFCRSCGFNLEKVAELLGEQPPALLSSDLVRAQQQQRRLEHWASVGGLAMILLVVLMVIYLVVSEMMIKSGKIGVGLLLLLLFLGGAVMAGLQGYSKTLKQRLANQRAGSGLDLPAGATKQLDAHREPVESVTERTTELLIAQPSSPRVNTKEL
jgi:uncharacterized integral membrane protein